MKRFLCLLILTFVVSGCTSVMDTFKKSPTNVSDVYYDEFLDIPIPTPMKVDREQSMVSVTTSGEKTGLVTVSGDVEIQSLTTAMIHNMAQQGWSLRSMIRGNRILEIFEKQNRLAVLYFYPTTFSVSMEMWVGQRLADGAMNVVPSLDTELNTSPSFEIDEPATSTK